LKSLLHRAVLALVLLAFLVPMPTPTPADEVRASYAAAGLLCDPGETGDSHRKAHCVLCLLQAVDAGSDASSLPKPALASRATGTLYQSALIVARSAARQQARAPPSSIV
jgi:hypothetical protein